MKQLSAKYLFFIITAITIVSIKTYPIIFTKHCGRDSWLALLIASIFILFFIIFFLHVSKKRHMYNFFNIYQTALGKTLGNIFLFLFTLNVFLISVESSSVEASAMHNAFFNHTPTWKLILVSIPVAIYIGKLGYPSVINCILIGIFFISLSGTILVFLTYSYKDLHRLLPIMQNGFNKNFLIGLIKLIGTYSSITIILIFFSDVDDTNNLTKYCLLGMLFVFQIQMVSIVGTLSTFEIDILNSMSFPKIVQTQLIRQSSFLDAGELFVMFQLIGGWILKLTLSFFAIIKVLDNFKLNNSFLIYIISILLYISSYFACKDLFILFNLLNILVYINLLNFIIFPIIIYIVFLIKTRHLSKMV